MNFKHYGLSPNQMDAVRLVEYVKQFLDLAIEQFFALTFANISLANLISFDVVKFKIKAAEEALRREDFEEVCGLCAEAFEISAARILSSVKYRGGAQMLIGIPLSVYDAIGEEASNDLKRYVEKLTASSNRVSLMLALSLDVNELHLFEGLVPGIVQKRDGTLKRTPWLGIGPFTPEDFSFAVDFATRFAVAVDARVPMVPKEPGALEPNL
ncbi:hypothetical protein ACFQI9_15040 [Paraburkholderia dipogonis]|uniref:hypothetical protein n=1 Tax=Paraburkholderia dipogonis TaxID=1211383 RepID=UPI0036199386